MRTYSARCSILLIMLIALAPLVTACSPFGDDDDDDDAGLDETPTLAADDTPEVGDTPEVSDTAEVDETGTAPADPSETPQGPAPGDETPGASPTADDEGTPSASPEIDPVAQGAQIFANVCAACHQPDGQGIEGIYPALADSPFVTLEDPQPVIEVVLTGRGGMPRFGGTYSDAEIAGIITYLRTELGNNDASEVDPETVTEVRESIQEADEGAEDSGGDQTDNDD